MKEGETWVKGTATSSTVVGALIITIMFAAAITIPGGNNQNTGSQYSYIKSHFCSLSYVVHYHSVFPQRQY